MLLINYNVNFIVFHLWFQIILSLITYVKNDDIEYNLVHKLFKNYDSSIRPSSSYNNTLNVTFGLALVQLIDVDERNLVITTNCWLNQGWIDPMLAWNPSEHGGIETLYIPVEKIWKPDIMLTNNADPLARLSSISTNAIIRYNGNVTWLSTVIFKSSCSINVKYFPFDEQNCDLIFASWTYNGRLLNIDVPSHDGDVSNYMNNGEWSLIRLNVTRKLAVYSCCDEPFPEIFYSLVIRRRPLFYVFNMVFPCLLITLVAFLAFYLPPGSNEKVSIGITTLLSITVFFMLVVESMPPTSDQLPLLGVYYAVTISMVSFSTTMTVVTLNISSKGHRNHEIPSIMKIIFFDYVAPVFRIRVGSQRIRHKDIESLQETNKAYHQINEQNQRNHVPLLTLKTENCDNECLPVIVQRKRKQTNITQRKQIITLKSQKIEHLNIPLQSCESNADKKLIDVLTSLQNLLLLNELNYKEQERKQKLINEWHDLALVIDRILCYFFIISTLLVCTLVFLNSPYTLSPW